MVRNTLLFLSIAAVTTCCTLSFLPDAPREEPKACYRIDFNPPVDRPGPNQLWVCGLIEGEFACIDYDIFHQSLLEKQKKQKKEVVTEI